MAGVSSASSSCTAIPTDLSMSVTSGISTAVSLSFIAVLFSFAMVALSYMVGEVLKVEGLKKWYQGELWETIKSILIMVSIFSILVIASGIATAVAGNASTAQFSLSGTRSTLGTYIWDNLATFYYSTYCNYIQPENTSLSNSFAGVYGVALGTDLLKSLTLDLYVPIPLPVLPPVFAGFMFGSKSNIYVSSIIDTTGKTTSFLADFTMVIIMPLYLLFAMQANYFYLILMLGLGFFLPFGIILRAIPIVRPIGGTLMAIGIGISLIYPALFIFMNLPITALENSIFIPPSVSSTSLTGAAAIFNYFITTIINFYTSWASTAAGGFWAGITGIAGVYGPLNYITYTLVDVIVQFMLLIFDLVIGIVVTDHIAKLFGGRLPTGIGKFKVA
ncbi:MAG: hypothetical protein ACP5NE_01540 [Candidatus Micrarchaeia archaeon]